MTKIIQGKCQDILKSDPLFRASGEIALTFLDPPFNQGKEYGSVDDALPEAEYWEMMRALCLQIYELTEQGGAIYFMQREKNTEFVLRCLRETGWHFQNLIIWTKRTSAVPGTIRYGKQYQIIAFGTKGRRPRVFNRLRIDLPLRPEHKNPREEGVFVTDVWDDIRELTSGYFAGDEALRLANGERAHKQQAPIALLLRILLSSTLRGDRVLDPFAGTGTTLVVAEQLSRDGIGIEIDSKNVKLIRERLSDRRRADAIEPLREYYRFTPNLSELWSSQKVELVTKASGKQLTFLESGGKYKNGSV